MKLLIITQKVDSRDQLLGFFIDWIRKFSEKFGKITVLCLEKGEFSLPDNVKVISLGKDRGAGKLKQLFNFYFSIFNLRSEYDAIVVHMNPVWMVVGGLYWKIMRKRRYFWYTTKGVTFKLKLAEKFSDIIFTASKESFRLPSKKVIVTGHGIDTRLFQPGLNPKVESEKLRILSVGRIAPVKNYETLVNAAKILKDQGLNFQVTIIGEVALERDKKYEENLKFKIENLKLTDYFNFVGKINHQDLPSYYQSHDIFIHLSKTGSLDKTILEAMACGMRVLSSNDSAQSFLLAELLFNESNPSELADKIVAVAYRPTDLALREYVIKNHNLEILIEKISRVINQQ